MAIATPNGTRTDTIESIEPTWDNIDGIWDEHDKELYTRYIVTAQFTGKVMGGVPQKPEAIEGWIRQRVQGGDEEVKQLMHKTLDELEVDTDGMTSIEQLYEAAKRFSSEQHGNTFRRDANGLYLSAYQLKAAIRENINILYAGDKWGKTRKSPKGFVAERVFIDEDRIYLGRMVPDGKHLQVGHINGPRGPRSTLTYYDYVERADITFTVSSLRDGVAAVHWRDTFLSMQRNGLGAIRSMGYGQFKVTGFDRQSS